MMLMVVVGIFFVPAAMVGDVYWGRSVARLA